MGPEVVPLFSNNREQNQINPGAKRLPQATWESHDVAASQSDQRPDLSYPQH